jgi:iron complex outermembrane recepter protein|tara:strand:+ start:23939 stop:24106 length:168 start_codon:yes stop_codon:yes gene_type:complete
VSIGRNDAGWQLYGYVWNLANTARKSFAYDLSFIGMGVASYAPPRTYGVGFTKTF